MICPFCGSTDIDIPTVDIGVGECQCGSALCNICLSYQDQNGEWVKYDHNTK